MPQAIPGRKWQTARKGFKDRVSESISIEHRMDFNLATQQSAKINSSLLLPNPHTQAPSYICIYTSNTRLIIITGNVRPPIYPPSASTLLPNTTGEHLWIRKGLLSCQRKQFPSVYWPTVHATVDIPVMGCWVLLSWPSESALPAAPAAASAATYMFVIRTAPIMLFEVLWACSSGSGKVLHAPSKGMFLEMLGAPSTVPGMFRAAPWSVLLEMFRAPTQHMLGQHFRAAPGMWVPLLLWAAFAQGLVVLRARSFQCFGVVWGPRSPGFL